MSTLSENPDCNPRCRACHYKDLDYAAQLARKQAWAAERLARWSDVLQPIAPAPPDERLAYRAKSWLRPRFAAGRLEFGMFRAVRGDAKWEQEFISWDTCPLHSDAIRETTARLGRALVAHAPEFTAEAFFGVWIGVPHVVVVGREAAVDALRAFDWKGILVPPFTHAWFHRTNQVGKSVFGEGPFVPLHGAAIPGARPIRSFRQSARTLLAHARARAVAALRADDPELVLDLYCGAGDLAPALPPAMGWLGIETAKDAVAYANTLRPAAAATHRAYLGLIEQRLRDSRVRAEVPAHYALFINPPRPGLGEAGRAALFEFFAAKRPTAIAYLSCSASTLARDLGAFVDAGYAVESLQPYDFFPQTEHFETLAILRRRAPI